MFIRTIDDSIMYRYNIHKNNFEPFSFNKHKKRKNNIIKQFYINENDNIQYTQSVLKTKLISKQIQQLFSQKDITVVVTADKTLIFQDTEESPCRFLTIDEISDCIIPVDVADILVGETEILMYDYQLDDFYFAKVISATRYKYLNSTLLSDSSENKKIVQENNKTFTKLLSQLSRYFIYVPRGIIINDFMLI